MMIFIQLTPPVKVEKNISQLNFNIIKISEIDNLEKQSRSIKITSMQTLA
jgi:hypothetical protein